MGASIQRSRDGAAGRPGAFTGLKCGVWRTGWPLAGAEAMGRAPLPLSQFGFFAITLVPPSVEALWAAVGPIGAQEGLAYRP